MNKKPLCFTAIALLLMLVVSACTAAPPEGPNATITALVATIQAQQTVLIPVTGPTEAPTITPTTTLIPTVTPPPTPIPIPIVPMVSVSVATNCRSGPGIEYDWLGLLVPGQLVQVIGKYTAGNYWIIVNPSNAGSCWLWGQYATVSGNINGLPEMYPPPSPTPALPAAPENFTSKVSCTPDGLLLYNVHVNLSWTDEATNEDGYYFYRNGKLLATLDADTTGVSDNTTLPITITAGTPVPHIDYKLVAFNGVGVSDARTLRVVCP